MRTPSARQEFIRRRHDPVQRPTKEQAQHYVAQLNRLSVMIPRDQFDWQIEGGLAVDLHTGPFSREHCDVDVAFFADQLPAVESHLAERGYRLFSRNGFHALEYAPVDSYRATSADEILGKKRVKRMTAMKVDRSGRIDCRESVLTGFDMHVHRRSCDSVFLDQGHVAFPRDLFDKDRVFEIDSGRTVRAASLPFMYYFKLDGRAARHQFDLELL